MKKSKKIIWITLNIILFIIAISYLTIINSVEEPFEEQGREKATTTGESVINLMKTKNYLVFT